ncbi:MAG TPA: hypothetical protein VM324_00920 [Egibacteraceae bacterium]|nr:hypothetical protein [Egibacteraceae bacterium]
MMRTVMLRARRMTMEGMRIMAATKRRNDSGTENQTVEHLEQLLSAAKDAGTPVFVSPHYYYPHDDQWQFGGQLEQMMHDIDMFERSGPLDAEGLEGSGADGTTPSSPTSPTARPSSPAPTRCTGRRTTPCVLTTEEATKALAG